MPAITTIVHFTVPAENADRFLAFWQGVIRDEMKRRPGLVDGVLHRSIDADGPYQFINVARWQSAEALESGLRETAQALRQEGVDLAAVMRDLGVTISQHNYVEESRYVGDPQG
jgi:heme-degrading monooxygenase HmoA